MGLILDELFRFIFRNIVSPFNLYSPVVIIDSESIHIPFPYNSLVGIGLCWRTKFFGEIGNEVFNPSFHSWYIPLVKSPSAFVQAAGQIG